MAEQLKKDDNVTRINERNSINHVSVSDFRMCILDTYPYRMFPKIYTLNSTISLEKSGVFNVRNFTNLPLYGQGILMAFIDTGIDYQHQAFRNTDGTSRIYSIWDQTIENGPPPAGFTFGTEYSKNLLNYALKQSNPYSSVPSTDNNGHGTMLAGIAAGNPNKIEDFSGIATSAELIVVKLKQAKRYSRRIFSVPDNIECYQESDIMFGIEYVRSVAAKINKPLIICIGMGSSQGSHDGSGTLSLLINNLSITPRIGISVAAGNEGNSYRHYKGEVTENNFKTQFHLNVSEQDKMFSLEIWQGLPFRLAVTITSPSGEKTTLVSPGLNECREFDFNLDSSILYISNINFEEETGNQLILIRFENAKSGIWTIELVSLEKRAITFHAWLPSGNLISTETYFFEPDPNITITSPGNAENTVTVTAYNQNNDNIITDSSRGFTLSTVVKPDIAAPGYQLTCPTLQNSYGSATGTGAAAAHTAGIMALIMEWAALKGNYTTITGRNIGGLLNRGASRNPNMVYPNPIWGYGKLDLYGLFRQLT
ncbi:MAG TPA: peptidase S8 [Lachnoclostridium phytofermentans]|uniref:Peptidase S8 n=1 Tax=Lachnoclostridium phytofermentans TaxID=66219 RepID=A0A3D2X2E0_9FIRM|nr:S8 family peptidase [Lachnoclostridium sp.]HCL01054.1 peptidase S8 [Lachnoclostridium phytofermentans]